MYSNATRIAQLQLEHAQLEARLREMDNHLSLTTSEQFERAQIKKLKLAKKDEILQLSVPSARFRESDF